MRRLLGLMTVVLLVGGLCAGCLLSPGDTSQIALVSSFTKNGWRYDYYRNSAYPCSISGYQTFVIGTEIGSSATSTAPLWVWLHGGGVGYFDSNGQPQPDANQMTEQSVSITGGITNPGLASRLQGDPAGFRMLAVSYCDRDLYSGTGQVDPHNPNPGPGGSPRRTNGLLATKAAIAFTEATYPTSKYLVGGGSAGSVGSYAVGYAMQLSGNPPAGVVGDASVVNLEAGQASFEQGVCTSGHYDPAQTAIITQRIDPALADPANEVDRLVSSGKYTVPLLHIWNHGDVNTCGSPPVACPLRDGTTVTMGNTDCIHEPLEAAIAAEGAGSRSLNLPVCVDADSTPNCSLHVVTTHAGLVNTDPASPTDYVGAVVKWIDARLADP